MAYEVPDLPYGYDALEPHIDEATMKVHHDKHHQAYVDKANAALEGTELADRPIEDVIANLSDVPEDKRGAVRNNGGGHLNHTLFWESMSPDGGGQPDGALADAINDAFGSFDGFKEKVKETGVGQFGSGWAWLVHDGSGLAVVGTPNQDNPITDGKTRLLPEVPEQAPGLHRRVVEHGRLVEGRRAVRSGRLVLEKPEDVLGDLLAPVLLQEVRGALDAHLLARARDHRGEPVAGLRVRKHRVGVRERDQRGLLPLA
jgi:Fe-Mn family superoxide dismutase